MWYKKALRQYIVPKDTNVQPEHLDTVVGDFASEQKDHKDFQETLETKLEKQRQKQNPILSQLGMSQYESGNGAMTLKGCLPQMDAGQAPGWIGLKDNLPSTHNYI